MSLDRAAVHQIVPQITDEEIDATLALIAKQDDADLLVAMLGLDGTATTLHKSSNTKGRIYQ